MLAPQDSGIRSLDYLISWYGVRGGRALLDGVLAITDTQLTVGLAEGHSRLLCSKWERVDPSPPCAAGALARVREWLRRRYQEIH
jgi:hypothetical protein